MNLSHEGPRGHKDNKPISASQLDRRAGRRELSKLQAALALAGQGFPVFPVVPNGKAPAVKNWRNLATSDPTQVGQWWRESPDANIGIATDDLLVIDIDPRKGGIESFQTLSLLEDFPRTARTETWSGGAHVLYRLPADTRVKSGVDVLGPGLDVRSAGGLIVAPGSEIDGRSYRWANNQPVNEAPEWLIARCKRGKPKSEAAGVRLVEEDAEAIARARAWLDTAAPEAWEGSRDDTAFRVAARLGDFGVSAASCRELLAEWNFTHCQPPMDAEAIERVAASGMRNRSNPIGMLHSANASGFEAVEITDRVTPGEAVGRRGLYFVSFDEAASRALATGAKPLIKGLLDCGAMSVVYGESNSGKTFGASDMSFHMAVGRPWFGLRVNGCPTVYVAAEGGAGVFKRFAALKQHHGVDNVPMFVIPCPVDLRNPAADIKPLVNLLRDIEQRAGRAVGHITIDTLSRAIAGGDENSSVDMGLMVRHFDAIRDASGAHLTVVHHAGKDRARGARGHSLLRAATDTEIEVADRTFTVTKQRDMEGGMVLPFKLVPVRIGVDGDGDLITSCVVYQRMKGEPAEAPAPLDAEAIDLLEEIDEALARKYVKNPKDMYEQPFSTAFAIECARKAMPNDARAHQADLGPMRDHVNRLMRTMREKGYFEKRERGQWVRIDAHDAQN